MTHIKPGQLMLTMRDIDRFWSSVSMLADGECWKWKGCMSKLGYGRISIAGKARRAHRVALVASGSPPPHPSAHALHSCHNRLCCNPAHLRWGTHRENMIECSQALRFDQTRLHPEAVIEIRKRNATVHELARRYGVSRAAIRFARDGKTWAWVDV